jgi:hypothetical protein
VVPGMCRVLEVVRVGAILSGERVTLLRADEAILCRIGSIFELRSRQDWEEEGKQGWQEYATWLGIFQHFFNSRNSNPASTRFSRMHASMSHD